MRYHATTPLLSVVVIMPSSCHHRDIRMMCRYCLIWIIGITTTICDDQKTRKEDHNKPTTVLYRHMGKHHTYIHTDDTILSDCDCRDGEDCCGDYVRHDDDDDDDDDDDAGCVCVLLCSAAMVSWVLTTRPATKSSALSGAPSNPTTSNTTKQSGGGDVYNTAYHAQRYWYMLCASCCCRCVCVCVPVCASFCVVALRHQQ